jgi:Domain of unknown function (DUF4862)
MSSNPQKIIVGAYAAYTSAKDPEIQWQVLKELSSREYIRGLEIPITRKGEIHSLQKLSGYLPVHWRSVLTCIPGTMQNLDTNPSYGLASNNEESRQAALNFLKLTHQNALELNELKGALAIEAIEIHSAPKAAPHQSSRAAFQRSVEEIQTWPWQGIELLIEHCDRYQEKFPMAKGFLSLEQEIASIQNLKIPGIRFVINWGRSVLEERDVANPARQIKTLTGQKLLGGLMFSGVTAADPFYGEWQDSHAPFDSLMDRATVQECLRLSDGCERVGFKIQALPKTLTVEQRISLIDRSADYLAGCLVSS